MIIAHSLSFERLCPAWLLKDAADIATRLLTIIINASLQSGRVPDDWKVARGIPLFKKGNADSHPARAFENPGKDRTSAANDITICSKKIFCARINVIFVNAIRLSQQGQLTGAVFTDFGKAFDTVDHGVLLDKLSAVIGPEHEWFTDYLRNRT